MQINSDVFTPSCYPTDKQDRQTNNGDYIIILLRGGNNWKLL